MTDYTPRVELAFRLEVSCGAPQNIGRIRGGNAMMIPITGGTVSGERLCGEVMAGGADWAVVGDDGISRVDAHYAIKADDGTIIQVFNSGASLIDRSNPASMTMLTTPRFVAPEGPHDWLNRAVFVGTLGLAPSSENFAVSIGIFTLV